MGATFYSQDDLDESELQQFLSQRLAKFKIPRYLHSQRVPLPRTASGKILKREIREQAVNQVLS